MADAAASTAVDGDSGDEAEVAGNNENAPAAANIGQNEQVPGNTLAKQAKAVYSEQPFIKALVNAATLAKVW